MPNSVFSAGEASAPAVLLGLLVGIVLGVRLRVLLAHLTGLDPRSTRWWAWELGAAFLLAGLLGVAVKPGSSAAWAVVAVGVTSTAYAATSGAYGFRLHAEAPRRLRWGASHLICTLAIGVAGNALGGVVAKVLER